MADGVVKIAEINKHAVGVIGVNGGTDQSNDVVREADTVIVLGSKLDNVTTVAKTLLRDDPKLFKWI